MMKKSMRLISAAMAIVLTMVCLIGCGSSGNNVEGTYKTVSLSSDGRTIETNSDEARNSGITDEFMVINLGKDGSGNIKFQGQYHDLSYKLEGETIYLTVEGDTQDATIKDGKITINLAEITINLEKVD